MADLGECGAGGLRASGELTVGGELAASPLRVCGVFVVVWSQIGGSAGSELTGWTSASMLPPTFMAARRNSRRGPLPVGLSHHASLTTPQAFGQG